MATVAIPGTSVVTQFVKLLTKRMEETGTTPTELARAAKVGRPYLYRVLKGEQDPSMIWAEKVGREMGIEVSIVRKQAKGGRRRAG